MRLRKLEIKGFKSFGDKTVINFSEGVTGIVGPNGCGKSNIVDAVRWVLGEQKTTLLRSDKMENVIFNGSKTRKKLQLAEVTITFDNTKNVIPTEYSNVSVTRKYFRSGDSEYLLNDVKCRLKDITNLFLDTGISLNNYAIIELSMVDNILNNKGFILPTAMMLGAIGMIFTLVPFINLINREIRLDHRITKTKARFNAESGRIS